MTALPKEFPIPAGTPRTKCRYCDDLIYFVEQPSGRVMPISTKYEHCFDPGDETSQPNGVGISHFINCPGADQARKPRGASSGAGT